MVFDSLQLASRESAELFEIATSLIMVEDYETFRALAISLKDLVEYDYIIFGRPRHDSAQNTAVNAINVNYPEEWVELYQTREFWRIDPVVSAAMEHCAPQSWGDIYSKYPPNSDFLHLAHDFGLVNGWTCLVKEQTGSSWTLISVGTGSLSSKGKGERVKYILERLAPHFHVALSTLLCRQQAASLQQLLTKREREVLKWLSQGKTSWEISVIFNVAESTVNFHVRNINTKLNTVNRCHAVAVAARSDLFECEAIY